MFKNYMSVTLRNLMKNKLYSLINIVGLALGLAIYVFGSILVDYERDGFNGSLQHMINSLTAKRIEAYGTPGPDE